VRVSASELDPNLSNNSASVLYHTAPGGHASGQEAQSWSVVDKTEAELLERLGSNSEALTRTKFEESAGNFGESGDGDSGVSLVGEGTQLANDPAAEIAAGTLAIVTDTKVVPAGAAGQHVCEHDIGEGVGPNIRHDQLISEQVSKVVARGCPKQARHNQRRDPHNRRCLNSKPNPR